MSNRLDTTKERIRVSENTANRNFKTENQSGEKKKNRISKDYEITTKGVVYARWDYPKKHEGNRRNI